MSPPAEPRHLEHLRFIFTAGDGSTHIRCECPEWFRAGTADEAVAAFELHAASLEDERVIWTLAYMRAQTAAYSKGNHESR
jgi:hypothetical protein